MDTQGFEPAGLSFLKEKEKEIAPRGIRMGRRESERDLGISREGNERE